MSNNIYLVGLHHKDIDGATRIKFFLEKIKPKIIALEWDDIRDAGTASDFPSIEEIVNDCKRAYEYLRNSFDDNQQFFENYCTEIHQTTGLKLNSKQLALHIVTSYLMDIQIPPYMVRIPKQHVQSHPESELHYIDLPRENIEEIIDTCNANLVEGTKALLADLDSSTQESISEILSYDFDQWFSWYRETIAEDYDKEKAFELFENISADVKESGGDTYSRAVYDIERENYMSEKIRKLSRVNQGNMAVFVGIGHLLRLYNKIKDLNPEVLTLSECDKD